MKKLIACLFTLTMSSIGFAETIIINNNTNYPNKTHSSRIAVQWATNFNEIQQYNRALMYESKLKQNIITPSLVEGTNKLTLPKNAKHFRIVVWEKSKTTPELLTNWVDMVPNKTYTLQQDQLAPAVLMVGSGC